MLSIFSINFFVEAISSASFFCSNHSSLISPTLALLHKTTRRRPLHPKPIPEIANPPLSPILKSVSLPAGRQVPNLQSQLTISSALSTPTPAPGPSSTTRNSKSSKLLSTHLSFRALLLSSRALVACLPAGRRDPFQKRFLHALRLVEMTTNLNLKFSPSNSLVSPLFLGSNSQRGFRSQLNLVRPWSILNTLGTQSHLYRSITHQNFCVVQVG